MSSAAGVRGETKGITMATDGMRWVTGLALAAALAGTAADGRAAERRPNVVLLVADDMGFADCGAYGCKDIRTPNIDALAKNGVRFLNGYTSGCVCSPTRAGLMSGRYQQRFGFDANAEGKAAPADAVLSGAAARGPAD